MAHTRKEKQALSRDITHPGLQSGSSSFFCFSRSIDLSNYFVSCRLQVAAAFLEHSYAMGGFVFLMFYLQLQEVWTRSDLEDDLKYVPQRCRGQVLLLS